MRYLPHTVQILTPSAVEPAPGRRRGSKRSAPRLAIARSPSVRPVSLLSRMEPATAQQGLLPRLSSVR